NVTVDIPTGTRTGANEIYVLLAGPVQGAKGTYAIQKGDTLNKISRQYGCSAQDLLVLNPGLDIYNLQVGQRLNVPGKVQ
ncbi:LysM peptidoglycan-binding domain-containing protein, partial [Eisenbergiella sp.]